MKRTGEPTPLPPDTPPSASLLARGLAGNATALWVSKVVSGLMMFGWQVVVAQHLGPFGLGLYATIGAVLALAATLSDAGLGVVVTRDVAARPRLASPVLATTLVVQPALAVVAALGASFVILASPGMAVPGLLVALASVVLVTDTLGNIYHAQLVAAGRLRAAALLTALHAVALATTGTALVTGGLALWGVYLAILVASLLRATAYWRVLGLAPTWPVRRPLAGSLLREGWPVAAIALVGLTRLHIDKLFTTSLLGPAATGQLQAAFVVVFGVTELFVGTLLLTALPAMARAWVGGEHRLFLTLMERLGAVGLVLTVPVAVGATLFGEWGVARVFGAAYSGTSPVLTLLLWSAVAGAITGVLGQVLMCQRRQRTLLVVRGATLGLHLLLLGVLIRRLGVAGAGWASIATEGLALVAMGWAVRVELRESWGLLVGRLVRVGAAAAVAAVLALLAAGHTSPLVGAVVFALAYAASVRLARGVSDDEWRALGGGLRQMIPRRTSR